MTDYSRGLRIEGGCGCGGVVYTHSSVPVCIQMNATLCNSHLTLPGAGDKHIHEHTQTHKQICAHTYTYTYTHTRTHTHTGELFLAAGLVLGASDLNFI